MEISESLALSTNLKRIRVQRRMTQLELAEKAGISRVAIGSYENGKRVPNAKTITLLADALGTSINELLNHNPIEEVKDEIRALEKRESELLKRRFKIRKQLDELEENKSTTSLESIDALNKEIDKVNIELEDLKSILEEKFNDFSILEQESFTDIGYLNYLDKPNADPTIINQYNEFQESILINMFRMLNAKGKDELIKIAVDLTSSHLRI